MFWTEWSSDPKIERADMAGEWRTTLMSKNLVTKPNGLALDRQNQKIYWADAHNDLVGLGLVNRKYVRSMKFCFCIDWRE